MASFLQSLDLNETDALMIPIGTVLFFILFRLLSTRLFQPLIVLIEERERRTIGSEQLSIELQEKAQDIRNRIEVRTSLAEAQHQAERQLIVERGRTEAAEIVAAAEAAASEILRRSRTEIEHECNQIRDHSMGRLEEVADSVARRIVEPSSECTRLQ
jgi:F0F1-type ATP synthase membrane subunit b/b'